MSSVGARDEFGWPSMRKKKDQISCSCLSPYGELFLEGDPGPWIEKNPTSCLLVKCLMLDLWKDGCQGTIPDSLWEKMAGLTHLYIENSDCQFPNSITRLHNLQVLHIESCEDIWFELPENLGELHRLRHLCVSSSYLKSVTNVTGLRNLQVLELRDCYSLKELPADLSELSKLFYINIESTAVNWLPWSITKLPNLRFLFLACRFRLEMLPHTLNDAIIISVKEHYPIRKTWNELKKEIIPPLLPILGAQNNYNLPNDGFHCDSILYPWQYLRLEGNPGPWIQHHRNLLSSVRFLDLSISFSDITIAECICEMSELTHLYIGGPLSGLKHLPKTITKLHKLEVLNVRDCRQLELPQNLYQLTSLRHLSINAYNNNIESITSMLESLSNLLTLCLDGDFCCKEFPGNLDKLISLRYLYLSCWKIELLLTSITKLSNLTTLELYACASIKVLPANLSLRKLKLTNCSKMSLPTSLFHLELSDCHETLYKEADIHELNLNELVNLETLCISCKRIKLIPSIARLHNLRELHLRDCFSLEKLPPYMDELINLCFLNLRGTRIKSLPSSIMKLNNLQCIIVPKCFRLDSLPSKIYGSVKVFVDDIDDKYYDNLGYYDCGVSSETTYKGNERVDKESGQEVVAEQASPCRQMNQNEAFQVMPMLLGHQVYGDSQQFSAGRDSIGESSNHAFCSLQNQEMVVSSLGNGHVSNLPTIELIDDNGQLRNGQMGTLTLENEHEIACDQLILSWDRGHSALDGNNHHAIENEQNDKNPQNDNVKSNKQKITREDIQSLLSRNMTLVDAAKALDVSRSTMKRRIKELGIKWQSSRKAKRSHNVPSRSNFSQPRLMNPTNPVDHDHVVAFANHEPQRMPSDILPFEHDPAANSTADARVRTIGAPNVSAQCQTYGHDHAPENFVVKATYKDDVVRFGFSSTSSVAELKEQVAKNLELDLGSFKIKYQDEEKEWMLLTREDHLSYVLCLSKSFGNKFVRLAIIDQ